jgi:hypothetical protein
MFRLQISRFGCHQGSRILAEIAGFSFDLKVPLYLNFQSNENGIELRSLNDLTGEEHLMELDHPLFLPSHQCK